MRTERIHIVILGFERSICTTVSNIIQTTLLAKAEDADNDYYINNNDTEFLSSYNGIRCNGFRTLVKYKYGGFRKEISVFDIADHYTALKVKNTAEADRIIYFVCFSCNDLVNGYAPFDNVNEQNTETLKRSLDAFMRCINGSTVYNVIYCPIVMLNEKIAYLFELSAIKQQHLDTDMLKQFVNESRSAVNMFDHFLYLPTLLMSDNYLSLNFLTKK